MPRIKYKKAPDVCCLAGRIISQGYFSHVKKDRIWCLSSWGAKTKAIARIHGLSSAWIAIGLEPGYIIEVIGEKFYSLSFEEQVKTVIHELLHIPYTFSGGLRPHGRLVNSRRVNTIYRKLSLDKLKDCYCISSIKQGGL
ncbi:MAG: metallopeptidase [Desulfurococcales archaeon]|nr:metallopeptidase [Desulfurococcales archaeon]